MNFAPSLSALSQYEKEVSAVKCRLNLCSVKLWGCKRQNRKDPWRARPGQRTEKDETEADVQLNSPTNFKWLENQAGG